MTRIVVTRPLPDGAAFANRLAAAGFETLLAPMMSVTPLPHETELGAYDAIIATSANALRHWNTKYINKKLPLWCTGKHTAHTARQAGFTNIKPVSGGAQNLLTKIIKNQTRSMRFLYVRGEDIAVKARDALEARGHAVTEIKTYAAIPTTKLSENLIAILRAGEVDGISFFSVRTASLLLDLCADKNLLPHLKSVTALCISENVLNSVRTPLWKAAYASKTANSDGVFDLITKIFEENPENGT